jgi:outer membrane murein-binding lipoprotein Lpp
MEALAANLDRNLKDLSAENRRLRSKVDQLSIDLSNKAVEAEEAREMNGIYSARLTRMKRSVKKLKDEDEESYIEITF